MTIESQHRCRDGRLIPIEVTGNYFEVDGAMHNMAIVRDISERKAAEAARRATERQLETVTTPIDDVFWLADAQRTEFSYVSPAYQRVFGCGAATRRGGRRWDRGVRGSPPMYRTRPGFVQGGDAAPAAGGASSLRGASRQARTHAAMASMSQGSTLKPVLESRYR